jgi:proline dehydrogenase
MDIEPKVRFDDTQTAFSYKSDRQLRTANWVFSFVNHPVISAVATWCAKVGLATGLPVKGLIRKTVFAHFCGGETILESERTTKALAQYNVGTILDYSVEGEKSEAGFDQTAAEIMRTVDKAQGNHNLPFCVFKVTGLADSGLLSKLHNKEKLNADEQLAFLRVKKRVEAICETAANAKVKVLVDAEETWLQDPIDDLATAMMEKHNQSEAIIFNTYQMYRADMTQKLRDAHHHSVQHNYFLGVKLVRGAYMEKERDRAEKMGYPDPIHESKEATDKAFNKGLTFCIDNKQRISVVCGSHNEYSNKFLTVLMEKYSVQKNDRRVWFAQLLGMSDNISFNLAKSGYNVAKYVPYGPVEAVMPYLIRRAQENTSVAGQSSRELTLIRKELKRRKGAK